MLYVVIFSLLIDYIGGRIHVYSLYEYSVLFSFSIHRQSVLFLAFAAFHTLDPLK